MIKRKREERFEPSKYRGVYKEKKIEDIERSLRELRGEWERSIKPV